MSKKRYWNVERLTRLGHLHFNEKIGIEELSLLHDKSCDAIEVQLNRIKLLLEEYPTSFNTLNY